MATLAEYIWIDGGEPTRKLRSKTKVLSDLETGAQLEDFPNWVFDGSSTNQADGDASDCILKPVNFFPDPIRGDGAYLVLCEVFKNIVIVTVDLFGGKGLGRIFHLKPLGQIRCK